MGLAAFNRMRREQAAEQGTESSVTDLDISKLNVKELRKELDDRGAQYDSNANKAELLDLLQQTLDGAKNETTSSK